MKNREAHYRKAEETVDKFKNGREKFQKSAMFNQVVQSLVRGTDPLDIIDQLITINEDTQRAFEQHLVLARPISFLTKPENHE